MDRRTRIGLAVFSLISGLAGLALFLYVDWRIALAYFLASWAENINTTLRLTKPKPVDANDVLAELKRMAATQYGDSTRWSEIN